MLSLDRRRFLFTALGSCGLAVGLGRLAPANLLTSQAAAKNSDAYPIAVAVGPKGAITIADKGQKIIYRVEEGNKLTVLYKGSRQYRTPLFNVMAMTADRVGNVFFCDPGSMDVWRMAPDGQLAPLTGEKIARGAGPAPANQDFDPEAAYAGKFDKPMGIVIDPDGNPIVADLGRAAIFRIPAAGGEPQEIARVPAPHGIALDRDGGFVVVSQAKDQLVHVSAKGEVTPIVTGQLAPQNNPHHVLVDQAGYIVSDTYAQAIWRVSPDGQVKPIVQGEPLVAPVGLALEPDGNILVADPHARKLFRVTPEGKITEVVSIPPTSESQ